MLVDTYLSTVLTTSYVYSEKIRCTGWKDFICTGRKIGRSVRNLCCLLEDALALRSQERPSKICLQTLAIYINWAIKEKITSLCSESFYFRRPDNEMKEFKFTATCIKIFRLTVFSFFFTVGKKEQHGGGSGTRGGRLLRRRVFRRVRRRRDWRRYGRNQRRSGYRIRRKNAAEAAEQCGIGICRQGWRPGQQIQAEYSALPGYCERQP